MEADWQDYEKCLTKSQKTEKKKKKRERETNNTINEIKSTLEGSNNRKNEAEEWVSELEDRLVEIIAVEQNKGKK